MNVYAKTGHYSVQNVLKKPKLHIHHLNIDFNQYSKDQKPSSNGSIFEMFELFPRYFPKSKPALGAYVIRLLLLSQTCIGIDLRCFLPNKYLFVGSIYLDNDGHFGWRIGIIFENFAPPLARCSTWSLVKIGQVVLRGGAMEPECQSLLPYY